MGLFTDTQGDVRTVEVTSFDSESIEMEHKAKECAYTLTQHYPAYPWCVGWAPGMTLVVKLMLAADNNFGYTIDAAKSFSASDLSKMAVMAGGELLERLGMHRGRWNGEMPTQNYEGIEDSRKAPIFDTNNIKGVEG